MTKYQQIAEPDGDGTPSRRATDDLTGTGSPSVAPTVPVVADAPVYLTRREAREAERRAARPVTAAASAATTTSATTTSATTTAAAATSTAAR
ncbi:hypothetical protein IFT36_04720, partial [Frigoribacterium sp. CFBP 13605]|uniref:hypothetical protein n=1 Tax=Frigoribacterium sp. CFBP 13605 TaxID=2774034 RepID=UPI001904253A